MVTGAEVVGWTPDLFYGGATAFKPYAFSRCAAQAMAGPVQCTPTVQGSSLPGTPESCFRSPCGLLLIGPQSGIHQLSATATRSVGHISSLFNSLARLLHSTALVTFLGEVLVLLRLELALIFLLSMLRSGLNSHLTPFQSPPSTGAVRFPPSLSVIRSI